jgi:hypothetical protein
MNTYVKREIECLICVKRFGEKPELVLTPKETELFTTVSTNLAAARGFGTEQVSGRSGYREGAAERFGIADEIRSVLRRISDMAKSMEEEGEVGMAERFRFAGKPTYEGLLATAGSFIEKATPMTAVFVARGFAATFLIDLQTLVTALETATGLKVDGGADQVAGTAGLEAFSRAGMKAVRILRPIMREHLKADPGLLAAWKSAARVARSAPAENPAETPAPPAEPPAGS